MIWYSVVRLSVVYNLLGWLLCSGEMPVTVMGVLGVGSSTENLFKELHNNLLYSFVELNWL